MKSPFPAIYTITKTSPCNEDPFTPHFYIVKLGFTGVYIIFALKHRLWVLNEAVLMCTHDQCFRAKKGKKIIVHLKINILASVKYCYIHVLHGRVCVMTKIDMVCTLIRRRRQH